VGGGSSGGTGWQSKKLRAGGRVNSRQIVRYIETHFQVVRERSTKSELCFICPSCGDQTGHRSVNLTSLLTNCWRCGSRDGHVAWWLRKIGHDLPDCYQDESEGYISAEDAAQALRRAAASLDHPPTPKRPCYPPVELPRGFIALADDEPLPGKKHSVYWKMAARLAERKNLSIEDFVAAGAGFTRQDDLWERYLIYPIRMYGLKVYFQGRLFDEEAGENTKRFPHRGQIGTGMGQVLYNHDALKGGKCAVIVESILNVLSLKKALEQAGLRDLAPVSSLHAGLTKDQLRLLRAAKLREICLLFDADATGKAWDLAKLVKWELSSVIVTVAEMPANPDNPTLDPNDDVQAAMHALESRTVWSETHALKRMQQRTTKQRQRTSLTSSRPATRIKPNSASVDDHCQRQPPMNLNPERELEGTDNLGIHPPDPNGGGSSRALMALMLVSSIRRVSLDGYQSCRESLNTRNMLRSSPVFESRRPRESGLIPHVPD
jgi:hypothetical protein